jgi:SAM-dependent methyltransferase
VAQRVVSGVPACDCTVNEAVYAVEAQIQSSHWWFEGRRRLLGRLLRQLDPRPRHRVLEVGAGTGANLPLLESLGVEQVIACDLSVDALRYAAARSRVALARVDATRLPFASGTMDLVLAADVIEHLDDDAAALREFVRVLKPGGHLVLTVPAFPSLWGPQDIVAHHRRRYQRAPLLSLVREAGVQVRTCFHFNYVLFAPILLTRQLLLRLRVPVASENQINTPWLNWVLTRVFFFDVDTAAALRVPFGVSLCVVAGKPPSP